jgi:HlyD family secretion protein
METYWNGASTDLYNRVVPMRLISWKLARRLLVVAVLLLAIALYFLRAGSSSAKLVTAPVTRGDVVQAVTATGTVNPVVTVQVGSYVSGPIVQMLCDFNTQVKKGQLCAKIDPRTYQNTLDQDLANLANATAQLHKDEATLEYDKITYGRDQALLKEHVVSPDAVDSAKSTYQAAAAQVEVDRANIMQQQASVNAARVSLGYTNIISPVDGTVVSRNVDLGQTVAASFQTPTLFLIAQDLTKMQVDTNVSESDVGPVTVGQKAGFTVDAFPNRTFWGSVSQVRQSPITVQNVVTYDVVIGVSNPELLLKPGMTANARIVTAERDNILKVPLQALRFSPNGSGDAHQRRHKAETESDRNAHLWVSNAGNLRRVDVVRGLDDGNVVEIVSGDLRPGDQVVIDQSTSAGNSKSNSLGSAPRMGMPRHL